MVIPSELPWSEKIVLHLAVRIVFSFQADLLCSCYVWAPCNLLCKSLNLSMTTFPQADFDSVSGWRSLQRGSAHRSDSVLSSLCDQEHEIEIDGIALSHLVLPYTVFDKSLKSFLKYVHTCIWPFSIFFWQDLDRTQIFAS